MEITTLTIDGVDIPHAQKKDLVLGKPFYMERVNGDSWDIFTHYITLPADIYDKLKDKLHFALIHHTHGVGMTPYTLHQGFTEYCAATSVERDGDKVHLRQARFRIVPYLRPWQKTYLEMNI